MISLDIKMTMDGIKFLKEINYSIAVQFINLVFPLIFLPILFDKFGVSQYAIYAHGLVFSYFFSNLFVNGFGSFFTRYYVYCKEEDRGRRVLSAQILFAIIGFLLLLLFLFLFSFEIHSEYFILSLLVLISAFNFEWLLYVKNELRFLFVRSLIHKSFLFIGLIFFFKKNDEITYYSIFYVISCFFFYVSSTLRVFSIKDILNIRLNFSFLKEAKYFAGSNLIGSFQMWGDQIIAGFLLSNENFAVLNICKQIISAMVSVSIAACRVLMNKTLLTLANNGREFLGIWKTTKKYFSIYIIFLALGILFFVCMGQHIVGYLSKNKIDLPLATILLCSSTFFITSVLVYIDTQINIPLNRENYTFISNIFACGFVGVFIYPLTYYFDINGALSTLLFSEILGLICMIFMNLKNKAWK